MFFRFSLQTRGQALANSLSLTHSPQQTHIQSLSLSLYLTRVEPSHSLCLSHSRHVQSVIFGQTQTIFPSLSLPFYLSLFHFPLSNILSLFSILIYSPSLSISSISLPLSSSLSLSFSLACVKTRTGVIHTDSVTRKKSPNVYKSCPKMI